MSTGKHLVKVWDLPTRVFHWLLVALIAGGFFTGYVSPEWWMGIHIWAGYGTVALVVFRIVWGVFGSQYSRISSFTFAPKDVVSHLRGVMMMRPPHYMGHNPTGAVMIFALILVIIGITMSGLLSLGGEENLGPLAGVTHFAVGDAAKEIHTFLVTTLLAMILIHISGVIVEGWLSGDNLVHSMITGDKKLPDETPHPPMRKSHPLAAALSLGAFIIVAGMILDTLNDLPPTGQVSLPPNARFEAECSDCHQIYHPSLLPAKSWQGLMANLDNHFGEDASLGAAAIREITSYLVANAAEKWDTEASQRLRTVSKKNPWQITATPYWVQKHSKIDKSVFARKKVGSKSRCNSCHEGIKNGRFMDRKIRIPKE